MEKRGGITSGRTGGGGRRRSRGGGALKIRRRGSSSQWRRGSSPRPRRRGSSSPSWWRGVEDPAAGLLLSVAWRRLAACAAISASLSPSTRVLSRVGSRGSKGIREDRPVETPCTKWAVGDFEGFWPTRGKSSRNPSNPLAPNEASMKDTVHSITFSLPFTSKHVISTLLTESDLATRNEKKVTGRRRKSGEAPRALLPHLEAKRPARDARPATESSYCIRGTPRSARRPSAPLLRPARPPSRAALASALPVGVKRRTAPSNSGDLQ